MDRKVFVHTLLSEPRIFAPPAVAGDLTDYTELNFVLKGQNSYPGHPGNPNHRGKDGKEAEEQQ